MELAPMLAHARVSLATCLLAAAAAFAPLAAGQGIINGFGPEILPSGPTPPRPPVHEDFDIFQGLDIERILVFGVLDPATDISGTFGDATILLPTAENVADLASANPTTTAVLLAPLPYITDLTTFYSRDYTSGFAALSPASISALRNALNQGVGFVSLAGSGLDVFGIDITGGDTPMVAWPPFFHFGPVDVGGVTYEFAQGRNLVYRDGELVQVAAVPEPASLALLAVALGTLAGLARRGRTRR